jgi:flagellin
MSVFRVNTNVTSLQARESLRQTSDSQGRTINRVTSGLRIVASGDDAAGLAIANSLRSDQTTLSQGVRNANDGLSTLQTLDGGMNNIGRLLDRARTLATQSASGTFSGDRSVLNTEFSSVVGEIDRQAQAVGLSTGGTFARSLSVFIGGGRAANGITSTANGSVAVDLSNATVDARSLGLRGVQAQGVSSIDIGTGSASTSVSAILSDTTNRSSTAVSGFTDLYFKGPSFSDSSQVRVSVNTSGVTDIDTLVTAVNSAIDSAGNGTTAAATAFKNAGIRAAAVTDSSGRRSLSFTAANTAFQVAAGDRMSNALLGNVTSTSNPTGLTLANTVTGGSATLGAATTFGGTGAGTVTVRFQGANLTSAVNIDLAVTGGTTTVATALASLTSAVASNATLQAAGITVQTATAGSALVFANSRGERFEVLSSGDLSNSLGLGSFRKSTGLTGTFDYSSVTGAGGLFTAAAATLDVSIGGATAVTITGTASAATVGAQITMLNDQFAANATTAAAGLVATNNAGQIQIASTNGTTFRIAERTGTDILGFKAGGVATADAAETQAGDTTVNSFTSAGSQQTSLLSFSAIRNGDDDQTITFSANDSSGTAQSLAVVLRNDSTVRNAGTVDEAINAINTALQQSNNSTLRQIVAVKDKANGADPEGIRFASTLSNFRVGIGTNKSTTGIGSQGTVVTASTVGTGSTASIDSQAGAAQAVTALSVAVASLGTAQATVGRGQNQFTFAVNLAQSQLTNLAASESRIRDADLAEEAANLTRGQILLQAGISALAQANSAPQQVLSLLRG